MAVGANGHKIFNRIQYIFLANVSNWYDVVNMNEAFTKFTISFSEVASTNCTFTT